MFSVSTAWMLYLSYDYRQYVKKLSEFMDDESLFDAEESKEIDHYGNATSFYTVIDTKTGKLMSAYETRDQILKNIEEKNYIYLSRKAKGR